MPKIVADSSADLLSFEGIDFVSVPLTISTAERTFTDDADLDTHEMLDYLKGYNDRSFTACPATAAWMEAFENSDEVYVVTITSNLSGTYNAAMAAANIFMTEHPEVKIHVFDSLSTGPEMQLQIEKIAELVHSGCSFEEVVKKTEEYKSTLELYFSLCSLHNLSVNGRVSKIVAAAVGILNIRILAKASIDGVIEPISKARGDRRAVPEMVKIIKDRGCAGHKIRIAHVNNPELAEKYEEMLRTEYPDASIECYESRGLVSFYAENNGVLIAIETV